MYTEEEARVNKWCPMVRISTGTSNSDLHDNRESSRYNCIASDCMMWKWKSIYVDGKPQMHYKRNPEQLKEVCPKGVDKFGMKHRFNDDCCTLCGVERKFDNAPELIKGHCGLVK